MKKPKLTPPPQKLKFPLSINFKKILIPSLISLGLLLVILIIFQTIFTDKFYPVIFIGDSNVTFLTKEQASSLIDSKFNKRSKDKIVLNHNKDNFTIDLATSSAKIDYSKSLNKAFSLGHQGSIYQKLIEQFIIFVKRPIFTPEVNFSLDPQVAAISVATFIPPENASITVENLDSTSSAQIKVIESKNGLGLDQDKLKLLITNYLIFGDNLKTLPLKQVEPKVNTKTAQKAKDYLESISAHPLQLQYQTQNWTIDNKVFITLLNLEQDNSSPLDLKKLKNYLSNNIASKINQPVQEGLLQFDESSRKVVAFTASQDGKEVDVDKTISLITEALDSQDAKIINLPVNITHSKTQTGDVNNLGIKELIGRGQSNFAGSIPNRIYNVNLTAGKINGTLVPPDQIFSFNGTVGDISAATGFKQAYVIKDGRTVLDDGGGVCQDSTTLFRAVLNAGLPIIARTAHAYRVGYYEQGYSPGLDATVFYPTVDFQFKNDTGNNILIQAYVSGTSLTVDLYGTSDGRVSTLTKPVILNQTPPPPELRQDDPTLPRGQVKQVDFSAWGAQVYFKRTVTKNGEVVANETWRSNYKPWQAIYLVGTQD